MPLIGPILDDRTFEQLRDELVKRIPVYAPEWTDHNAGDPGIALLELFAHLGESLLFRFNQIPDATKVAFLRLLGVRPRPVLTARTLLVLETERPEGVQVLRGAEARAGAVAFETDNEVVAWPLETLAVGKTPAPEAPAPPRAGAGRTRSRPCPRRSGGGWPAGPPSPSTSPPPSPPTRWTPTGRPSTSPPPSTGPCGSPCSPRTPPTPACSPAGPSSSASSPTSNSRAPTTCAPATPTTPPGCGRATS